MIPQNFADAFERVKELVSIFRENEERYLSPGYSEAQARLDFIDKFWIALGWDVAHENQTDPYKQEVKVERGVATNEWRKRSDYAFLSPNFRDVRFYVEAEAARWDRQPRLLFPNNSLRLEQSHARGGTHGLRRAARARLPLQAGTPGVMFDRCLVSLPLYCNAELT